MSAVDLLLGLVLVVACLLIVSLPWIFLIAFWRNPRDYEKDNIGVIVCTIICIFEVASLIDWLTGHTSKLM